MEQQKLYQVKRVSCHSYVWPLSISGRMNLCSLCGMQEKEKREYEMKQQIQKKKKPGFDGNWYTDPNAHLQQKLV